MKTTNSKTKTFAFLGAAFVLLIALLFTACPQAAKPEEPPAPPPDKTYTVKGISFTMKKIAAVTGKSVGHPRYSGTQRCT